MPVADDESFADRLRKSIDALRDKMERGEPIECTTIRIEHTPDGPLTTLGKSTLQEWLSEQRQNDEELN